MKCGLEHAKSEIVDPLLFEPGEMMEEVAPADLIPKNPEGVSNINRVPDVYYLEEVPDIQEHFRKHTVLLKKHLDKEVNCESFFKSYRYILEMSYFAESKNTLEFWKSYIKQLYDQLSADDKTKLWITLQDLFNNQGKLL